MDRSADLLLPASEAARQLGLSPSGLRRLAMGYERVHGALPRDDRGGRLWTGEALARLDAARALVAAEGAPSVERALDLMASGQAPALATPVRPAPEAERHAELLARLDALGLALQAVARLGEDQGRRLAALEEENQKLRAALPAPASPPARRPWWGRLFGRRA